MLFASDPAVSKDSLIEAQLLMTQGLLLFCTEQVRFYLLLSINANNHQHYPHCCATCFSLQFEQALDLFTTIVESEGAIADSSTETDELTAAAAALALSTPHAAEEATIETAISSALWVHSQQVRRSTEHSNLAIAVNNLSICCLYVKQIRAAIQRLEQLILQHPARHLTDPVVFNLCTLYDLSYAPDTSNMKKKLMQRVASEYHVDDPILHWKSFRLS